MNTGQTEKEQPNMIKEDFIKLFSENPNADEVLEEINRLYDEETRLTNDFAEADSERNKWKTEAENANKRYRERFLSGAPVPKEPDPGADPIDALFKDE